MRFDRWAIILLLICLSAVPLCAQEAIPSQGTEREGLIPFKRKGTPSAESLARVVLVFFFTIGGGIGFMVILKRVLKKKGVLFPVKGSRINLFETKKISTKLTLFLISVDGNDYLLVQGGDQIQIMRLDEEEHSQRV